MTQQVHATAIQAEPRWPHPAADVDQLPLRDDVTRLDTLLVPADLAQPTQWRLRERVVPFLEVLLRAALERQTIGSVLETSRDELRLLAEQQAALRRGASALFFGLRSRLPTLVVAGS